MTPKRVSWKLPATTRQTSFVNTTHIPHAPAHTHTHTFATAILLRSLVAILLVQEGLHLEETQGQSEAGVVVYLRYHILGERQFICQVFHQHLVGCPALLSQLSWPLLSIQQRVRLGGFKPFCTSHVGFHHSHVFVDVTLGTTVM